jgi:hypothetical protein
MAAATRFRAREDPVQRRARTRLAGAALVLAVTGGLTGCTGVTGGEGAADTKPGDPSAAEPAPEGRFRTLPEPCGAVTRGTLERMLPGAAARAEETEQETAGEEPPGTPSPLDGEATLTYDTDRRVGCTWQSTTSLGSRQLMVDFQRIVSYDPQVSDDAQAGELFAERAEKAGVAGFGEQDAGTDAPSGSGTEPGADATGDEDPGDDGHSAPPDASSKAPRASNDSSPTGGEVGLDSPSPESSLPPRALKDIGNAAFIDDRLKTAADGHGSHRDITLVFRTSNVLVTVEYSQSIADAHRTPDSAELQKYAKDLARQLAEQFSDG